MVPNEIAFSKSIAVTRADSPSPTARAVCLSLMTPGPFVSWQIRQANGGLRSPNQRLNAVGGSSPRFGPTMRARLLPGIRFRHGTLRRRRRCFLSESDAMPENLVAAQGRAVQPGPRDRSHTSRRRLCQSCKLLMWPVQIDPRTHEHTVERSRCGGQRMKKITWPPCRARCASRLRSK